MGIPKRILEDVTDTEVSVLMVVASMLNLMITKGLLNVTEIEKELSDLKNSAWKAEEMSPDLARKIAELADVLKVTLSE